jgi:methylated-DNA-protein-cysteine methyltransferase-like protein
MDADIALSIMKAFRSPGGPNYSLNRKIMAKSKKKSKAPTKISRLGATTAKPVKEKLTFLRPSGKKDDSFFELVHEVARQIPRGRVTSYGAIAACLGTRLSARMVGWAMMAVPAAKKPVPAHRVVNRNGLLTGRHHYNPPERMQLLLEKEGVTIKDDTVVDFKKLFWDPAQEL